MRATRSAALPILMLVGALWFSGCAGQIAMVNWNGSPRPVVLTRTFGWSVVDRCGVAPEAGKAGDFQIDGQSQVLFDLKLHNVGRRLLSQMQIGVEIVGFSGAALQEDMLLVRRPTPPGASTRIAAHWPLPRGAARNVVAEVRSVWFQDGSTCTPAEPRPSAAPSSPAPPATRSSSRLRTLQESLNSAGYRCGTADGLMGPQTIHCIRDFQEENGMDVTGDADEATINRAQSGNIRRKRPEDEVTRPTPDSGNHEETEGGEGHEIW